LFYDRPVTDLGLNPFWDWFIGFLFKITLNCVSPIEFEEESALWFNNGRIVGPDTMWRRREYKLAWLR